MGSCVPSHRSLRNYQLPDSYKRNPLLQPSDEPSQDDTRLQVLRVVDVDGALDAAMRDIADFSLCWSTVNRS
jgi:hypothetical protein